MGRNVALRGVTIAAGVAVLFSMALHMASRLAYVFCAAALVMVPAWRALAADPAARGLDAFVQMPERAVVGRTLPVQMRLFGYPRIDATVPLSGVDVVVTWATKSFGTPPNDVPSVHGQSGAGGLMMADLLVPDGMREPTVQIRMSYLGRQRTREIRVSVLPLQPLSRALSVEKCPSCGSWSDPFVVAQNRSAPDPGARGPDRPSIWVSPISVVRGVSQHMVFRATYGWTPVVSEFRVKGEGLDVRVHTDERGFGVFQWMPPMTAGKKVPQTCHDCGHDPWTVETELRFAEVAPTSRRRFPHPEAWTVVVDWRLAGRVQLDRMVAHPGERVRARVTGSRGSFALMLIGGGREAGVGSWAENGERGTELTVPERALGAWWVVASSLKPGGPQLRPARLVIVPRTIPRLSAQLEPDASVADTDIVLRASLTDALGSPVRGSVGAVDLGDLDVGAIAPSHRSVSTPTAVIEEQRALDLRRWLWLDTGIEKDDLDSLVAGDLPALPVMLHANDSGSVDLEPAVQEVHFARQDAHDRFELLVRALESRIHDIVEGCAVRKGGSWRIDPGVVEDVLASSTTPGGQPWTWSDLTSIDPQVSFDNMARRVSRRKLMEALLAMGLPNDPPSDPRTAIRAMSERFAPPRDPWGRTFRFLRGAPGVRFLTPPGLGLCSAGPDRIFSTHDDVCDPFQRALKAGSVYARATEEERIVRSRAAVRSAEDVDEWRGLFEELGDSRHPSEVPLYERGLRRPRCYHGVCEHQPALLDHPSVATVVGGWLEPPTRTDAEGHARLVVPLGRECRLRNIFVYGLSEAGVPATTVLSITSACSPDKQPGTKR